MSLKMPQALGKDGSKCEAEDMDKNPNRMEESKPFKCPSCSTIVSFVKSHVRGVEPDMVQVAPFFRQIKNRMHEKVCEYNLESAFTTIQRESAPGVLDKDKDGKFVLRLLPQVLSERSSSNTKQALGVLPGSDNPTPCPNILNRGKCAPYVSTAVHLLKLKHRIDEFEGQIENLVLLRCQGHEILWTEFYWENGFRELWHHLNNTNKNVPWQSLRGIRSTVLRIESSSNPDVARIILKGSSHDPLLKFSDAEKESTNVFVELYRPQVYCFKNSLDRMPCEGDEVIVLACWEARMAEKTGNVPKSKRPMKTFFISTFLEHSRQLVVD